MPENKRKSVLNLIKESFSEWKEDNASRLSASLAYYTTFSMAPLFVLIISLVGLLVGQKAAQSAVVGQVQRMLGNQGQQFVQNMINAASQPHNGMLASVIGIIALIFGALGVFNEIQTSLNTIWEVKPKPVKGMVKSIWRLIRERILSFSMILVIGFVLIASLMLSTALAFLGSVLWGGSSMPAIVSTVINELISFIVIAVLFALMFKFLPDAKIAWRDVWLGAAVTSLLFNIGKFAIGYYVSHSKVGSTFGAAGALALILIWVYYSAQIFFFGAEITQVYANMYGHRIVPDKDAIRVTEEDRAQQGIPHQETVDSKAQEQEPVESKAKDWGTGS